MRTTDTVRSLEERSLNAWPSLQQILYDGWILRFSEGYTRRANSVNPMYRGSGGVYEKVMACESIYRSKRLPPAFRITPLAFPADLDSVLADRGYRREAPTSVQTLPLGNVLEAGGVEVCEHMPGEWLADYARLKGLSEGEARSLSSILRCVAAPAWFGAVRADGKRVSAGVLVQEGDCAGLYGVATHPQWQRKGYAGRLVGGLLAHARSQGVETAYLQVMVTNDPALQLYARLGFREIYRYWYRVRDN